MSKLNKWEEIKSFFDFIPEGTELELKGIDDKSKYFHPTFKISEKVILTCQCDTEYSSPYGFSLEFKSIVIGSYKFTPSISVDDSQLKLVVENFEKFESVIENSINRQIELFKLEQKVSSFRQNLFHSDLFDKIENIKKKKTKKELSRYLEEIQISLNEQGLI